MHSIFSWKTMIECREKLKCLLWECCFVVSIYNLANQQGFWIKKAIPFYINLNPNIFYYFEEACCALHLQAELETIATGRGKHILHMGNFSLNFGLQLQKLQRSLQILSRDATRSAGIVTALSILVRFSIRLLHCGEMACPYLSLCICVQISFR